MQPLYHRPIFHSPPQRTTQQLSSSAYQNQKLQQFNSPQLRNPYHSINERRMLPNSPQNIPNRISPFNIQPNPYETFNQRQSIPMEMQSSKQDHLPQPILSQAEAVRQNVQISSERIVSQVVSQKKIEHISEIIPPSQIIGGIYLGDSIATKMSRIVEDHKITGVLCCNKQASKNLKELGKQLYFKFLDMEDNQDYEIKKHFEHCFHFIQFVRIQGGNILIQCHAGISRSSTMLCAYLMKKNKWSLSQTINFVKGKRKMINPNPNFRRQLKNYEKELGLNETQSEDEKQEIQASGKQQNKDQNSMGNQKDQREQSREQQRGNVPRSPSYNPETPQKNQQPIGKVFNDQDQNSPVHHILSPTSLKHTLPSPSNKPISHHLPNQSINSPHNQHTPKSPHYQHAPNSPHYQHAPNPQHTPNPPHNPYISHHPNKYQTVHSNIRHISSSLSAEKYPRNNHFARH